MMESIKIKSTTKKVVKVGLFGIGLVSNSHLHKNGYCYLEEIERVFLK